MPVTLKDIADMVGVSVNTVSRALKDKPYIEEKTRQRIKNAAKALGYRPNLNARSLVLQKTSTIGFAVTESNNPVRMEFCEKLRCLLAADGYRLLTVAISYDWPEENCAAIDELIARHVDGLIIGAVWNDAGKFALENILQDCQKNSLPVVLFGQSDSALADCVEIDHVQSIYRLTKHLLQVGYQQIALSCDLAECASGYQQAMLEAGLGDCIASLEVSGHSMEIARNRMNEFLDSGKKLPQAIIATNDLCALGFLAALRSHSIRVPEDCAVAGIDNIDFGKFSNPTLTSIGFDNGECAQMVWQLLKNRIEKSASGAAIKAKVAQKLMVRESA